MRKRTTTSPTPSSISARSGARRRGVQMAPRPHKQPPRGHHAHRLLLGVAGGQQPVTRRAVSRAQKPPQHRQVVFDALKTLVLPPTISKETQMQDIVTNDLAKVLDGSLDRPGRPG